MNPRTTRRPRVLHLQFSDPSGYPPIHHATRLLTEAGFDVSLLSLRAPGQARSMAFPTIDHATMRYVGDLARPSAALFARFLGAAIAEAMRSRPRWIYASDAAATPAALAVQRALGTPIVYHEHDSPGAARSAFTRLVRATRRRVARTMTLGILPSVGRAEQFAAETDTQRPIHVAWNSPPRIEVGPARSASLDRPMRLLYQGTLVPARLPVALIDALAAVDGVELHVCGYETQDAIGHVDALRARATALGVSQRFVFHGALPERSAMLALARTCDVGLAMLQADDDVNVRFMLGASNKPFDYLSQGLPLLVSDRPDWRATFVDSSLGRAADLGDVARLAAA
ncbi:MAG: glycosyltransferase, partial [Polyangiales bacterium]